MNLDDRDSPWPSPPFLVLSGGPCSGKSTLLAELERRGHPVVSEAAKDAIEDPRVGGLRSVDPLAFQREVLARQLDKERTAAERHPDALVVFADRGVGDHFGYLRLAGIEPFPELLTAWRAARERYRAILFCEPSPTYRPAGHRDETPDEALVVHATLEREYRRVHDRILSVPWLPLAERVEHVLRVATRIP